MQPSGTEDSRLLQSKAAGQGNWGYQLKEPAQPGTCRCLKLRHLVKTSLTPACAGDSAADSSAAN
jgi:hypothetical protein